MENTKHSIKLDRENIFITGVSELVSFEEESIIAEIEDMILVICGKKLHVNKLNLDNGELSIDGEIVSLKYENYNSVKNKKSKASSIFSNLFK
ncbi:MAG: sporulation protein YabP [Clostridiales bacterium]|nr:sporulation protein YabP [Clostridiales bacterium]